MTLAEKIAKALIDIKEQPFKPIVIDNWRVDHTTTNGSTYLSRIGEITETNINQFSQLICKGRDKTHIMLLDDIENNPDREFYLSVVRKLGNVTVEHIAEDIYDPVALIEELFFKEEDNGFIGINKSNGQYYYDKDKTEQAYTNGCFDESTKKLIRSYLNHTNISIVESNYTPIRYMLFDKPYLPEDISLVKFFNYKFINRIKNNLITEVNDYLMYRYNHSNLEKLGFVLDSFESNQINATPRDRIVSYKLTFKE